MKKAKLTANKHGSMFPLALFTKAFLSYVKKHPGQVLDIGAAYGITSLPALEVGAKVAAMDLSREQLTILSNTAGPKYKKNLQLIVGRFPEDLPLKENYYDAILASHVLHFLGPKEFKIAVKKMYRVLKPGGHVFIQCFTPYHRFMEKFIPTYEKNLKAQKTWPGLTRASSRYVLKQNLLPSTVNLMDPVVLDREFSAVGFVIDRCEFTPCPKSLGKEIFVLDGKEWVGLIGHKSISIK